MKRWVILLVFSLCINTIIALAKLTREAEARGMIDIDQIFYIENVSLILSFLIVSGGALAIGLQASHKSFPLLKSFAVGMFSFLFSSFSGPVWLLIDLLCDLSVDILNGYLRVAIALWTGIVGFIIALKKGLPFLDCLAISFPIVFFGFITLTLSLPQDFIFFPLGLSLLVMLYFANVFGALYLVSRLILRSVPFQSLMSFPKGESR